MRSVLVVVLVAVFVTVFVGVWSGCEADGDRERELAAAVEKCHLDGSVGETVTVTPTTFREHMRVLCLLDRIDVPPSTARAMLATTALEGEQTAEWDGFTAVWSVDLEGDPTLSVSA